MDRHMEVGLGYMKVQPYSDGILALAHRYMSSDALFIIVCDAIARGLPLSVVRMGDGERMIIQVAQGAEPIKFLCDGVWLKQYGLLNADLKKIGEQLWTAAKDATFFGPNIYGLVNVGYDLHSVTAPRDEYVEGLFAYSWFSMGRVHNLLHYGGPIGLVCRHAKQIGVALGKKYGGGLVYELSDYDGWHDYEQALISIGRMEAKLVLCAVGPSGKSLVVEAASAYDKVVLDVGSAMVNHWC